MEHTALIEKADRERLFGKGVDIYKNYDESLSNMEIIEALETEIASKTSGSSYKGLGNVVHKMGFN